MRRGGRGGQDPPLPAGLPGLSLGRRKETLAGCPRPGLPVVPRPQVPQAGSEGRKEARGAPSGDSDFSSPSCLLLRSSPSILLLFICLMYQIIPLRVYRGFPSSVSFISPVLLEHYEAGNIQVKRAGERIWGLRGFVRPYPGFLDEDSSLYKSDSGPMSVRAIFTLWCLQEESSAQERRGGWRGAGMCRIIRLAETWKQHRKTKEWVIELLACLSKETEMKKNLESTILSYI